MFKRLRKFFRGTSNTKENKLETAPVYISGEGVVSVKSEELIKTQAFERQLEALKRLKKKLNLRAGYPGE